MSALANKKEIGPIVNYSKFKKLNGDHPYKNSCPKGHVEYSARSRHGGKVAYFNFDLAREMGLISGAENVLTNELSNSILDTFAITIINEYDILNNIQFPQEDILTRSYMATRYLQLQHPSKKGETSGDGRSIWNGIVKNKGKVWDVSSCGTGATCLSPATTIKKKYFQTGDPTVSYGCGLSEVDEGMGTLMMSEVFHKNGIPTERILVILEFADGYAINVRAHHNLIRPSHMFGLIKQSNHESLLQVVNYYIDRQLINREIELTDNTLGNRLNCFLDFVVEKFAKMTALFESEYIFCWLDWDGDNILMDGSIIDYGSVRQFGLFHHEYRYDDIDRYSTTITEQKGKAKYIVQTFAQAVDFLKTGIKKNIKIFSNDKSLKEFDSIYTKTKRSMCIRKLGLNKGAVSYLVINHAKQVDEFISYLSFFERSKSKEGIRETSDGLTQNAIFCVRDILREFPQFYLCHKRDLTPKEFIDIIKSSYALKEDLEITQYRKKKIKGFQKSYLNLIKIIAEVEKKSIDDILYSMLMRSSVINKIDRVTGDAVIKVADTIVKNSPKLSAEEIHSLMLRFREYQNLDPETKEIPLKARHKKEEKILKKVFKLVCDYREGL